MAALQRLSTATQRLIGWIGSLLNKLAWSVMLASLLCLCLLALALEGLTTYLGDYLGPAIYASAKENISPNYSVEISSADGHMLSFFGQDESRREPIAEVPATFADLLVAWEDARFYDHNGVDRVRLLGAFLQTVSGRMEGGSTLTMQLAKMVKGDAARTMRRKLDDMALALEIEKHHSKPEILRLYADHAYFGQNVYGLHNACRYYFSRLGCEGLTLAEAAFLVGLVKAPTKYANNRDLGQLRRDTVLLVAYGPDNPPQNLSFKEFVSWFVRDGIEDFWVREVMHRGQVSRKYGKDAILQAWATPLQINRDREISETPYLRDAAVSLVAERLGDKQMKRGATVQLTIDVTAQTVGHVALTEALSLAEEDGTLSELDGGVVVMNARTGDVIALIGGRDYGVSQVPFALRPIQVGSAMKPFVYATGFEEGILKPNSKVVDTPICIGGWCPKNYGNKYSGALLVEDALARSLNSVAVRTANQIGVAGLSMRFRELGFESPLQQNLTIALGASEVTMLELVQAYTAIYDGKMKPARLIEQAYSRQGQLLYSEPKGEQFPVFSPQSVASVREGMRRALQPGGTATRLGMALNEGWEQLGTAKVPDVSCKTGTTNESLRVGMVCLMSDSDLGEPLIAAVYIGNRVPQPLGKEATGGRLAGPAMKRILIGMANRKAVYKSFIEELKDGPVSEAKTLLVEAQSSSGAPLQAPAAYEADGQFWLRDLYDLGLPQKAFGELGQALGLRQETVEQYTETLRGDDWKHGSGVDRALLLATKFVRFATVRGLSARRAARTYVVPEPEGFSVVEEQPDRVVTQRTRGRTDVARVRVFVSGDQVTGVDLITTDKHGESWTRVGSKIKRVDAVRVAVGAGSLEPAWIRAGLDGRTWAEFRTLVSGSSVDLDRIRRGFEVNLLLVGHSIVAADVSSPDAQGKVVHTSFAHLPGGIFDGEGKLVGNRLWPISAKHVETFTFSKGKARVTTAAVFHAGGGKPVVAPTRVRVISADPYSHRIELQSTAGISFTLRGVMPLVQNGDVLASGELLGVVDRRGLFMADVPEGLNQVVTGVQSEPEPAAKAFVRQYLRQLEFVQHGPQPTKGIVPVENSNELSSMKNEDAPLVQ